jgi:Poly(ADP-ribose) polymerase and DNA-Ligase Zn-finger region
MAHVIEHAASGRAKCRGCGEKIAKDELRFGEREPNAFGEGDMTLWFHPACAAYKRPEPFLALLGDLEAEEISAAEMSIAHALKPSAEFGLEHRRVPRIDKADRAPTARARCRCCRELIAKDSWRIGLVFFEEYRFEPSGFIHAGCAEAYFGTTDIMERIGHFNPDLGSDELCEIESALAAPPALP